MITGKTIDFNNANIVVKANSLGTSQGGCIPWPDQLTTMINNPNCIVKNFSVSGLAISQFFDNVTTEIDPLIEPNKTNILFVNEMINERNFKRSATLEISIQKFKQYCLDRRAKGWKVIVMTQYDTEYPCRQELIDFNTYLKATWVGYANGIVDVWQEPMFRDATNRAIFFDGIHIGIPGTALLIPMVYNALKKMCI